MVISDWSSDVCASDLVGDGAVPGDASLETEGGDAPLEAGAIAGVPGVADEVEAPRPVGEAGEGLDQQVLALARNQRRHRQQPLRRRFGGTERQVERSVDAGADHADALVLDAEFGEPPGGGGAGGDDAGGGRQRRRLRSEEHTSELQSLMRISYAVFCLKKKKKQTQHNTPAS